MNNKISLNSRNCSIDIFRILFAVYVVALHSKHALFDAYPFLSVTIRSFFRFSVPFFFMVSGYYFFRNAKKITFKYIYTHYKQIVIVYLFWSGVYCIVNFIKWGHLSLVGFAVDCVYSFFTLGSYYHLWYFPALIFAICISALFCRFSCKKMLFCVSITLYPLCYLISKCDLTSFVHSGAVSTVLKGVPILQQLSSGLFYFCCGQLINVFYDKYASTKKIQSLTYILPISVVLWFAVIWCNYYFTLNLDLLIIFGIYFNVGLIILVLLTNPLPQFSAAGKKCRYLANFTYYIHPFFYFLLELINENWFTVSDYWHFPITLILTIATGMILYRLNNKYINRFIG